MHDVEGAREGAGEEEKREESKSSILEV